MAPQSFHTVILDYGQFLKPSFQYSLLMTSTVAPKILHLYLHFTSLPVLLYALYLPTFLALDVLNAILFWGLVHLKAHGSTIVSLSAFKFVICLTVLAAASMQIAFYLETGGEIRWGAAKKFSHDPAGIKVLLSGSMRTCVVSTSIVVFARVWSVPVYNGAELLLRNCAKAYRGRPLQSWDEPRETLEGVSVVEEGLSPTSMGEEEHLIGAAKDLEAASASFKYDKSTWYSFSTSRITFIAPVITVLILLTLRPTTFPYAHMSNSLPYTLLEVWESKADFCQSSFSAESGPFPFPDLVSTGLWESPKDLFPGWMPTANFSASEQQRQLPRPSWLPDHPIPGFERWYNGPTSEDFSFTEPENVHREREWIMQRGPAYDPTQDPLRIGNLDQDLLKPLAEALGKRRFHIKHVILLSLESTRSDVFPLKKDSHIYDMIMKSHQYAESIVKAESDLSDLTLNAELLTGETGDYSTEKTNGSSIVDSWRNLGLERGGITVQGAFTGSTTSLKSILGSHCGAQPLPVDFTVEAHQGIYQPCIPQILNLFNHNKQKGRNHNSGSNRKGDDMKSMPWRSVYAQSITDQYDHQDRLNMHMGFSEVIVKDNLSDPTSKHYPPVERESNYFGYPETELKAYLEDVFRDAEKNKQRLFLSHLTSSSHHPWSLPDSEGPNIDYLRRGRWGIERPLNRYLNTIRFVDHWIGEIMDMLEDLGLAKETLVVMVGDHGMAFEEDSKTYTTFENGHIKNLAVPLVFHHPSLPRIKLDVNATSLSILPTILDLLIATSSLGTQDLDIASNLIHQYEGQSLIRPYLTEKHGRQAWNIGVLNAGGAVLSVSSAAVPFRLVMPVCKAGTYRFTNTASDPNELVPIEESTISALMQNVETLYGHAASKWVVEAEKMGKWWVLEQRRRWGYYGAGLMKDRDPSELSDVGTIKKSHWWNT